MNRLPTRLIEKPWGQFKIDARFGASAGQRIGEVWFEALPRHSLEVMAKYLFTSERLSLQVHPDEATAHARRIPHGKDECWIILDAAPGAEIGIGTVQAMDAETLLRAAADGSIEQLIDWRPAEAGQFVYNPARTVHALGPGLTVLEVQQAADVTYRLYDYGRPRELHLEESRDVLDARPHFHPADRLIDFSQSCILVDGPYFGVAWCAGEPPRLPPGVTSLEMQLLPVDRDVMLGKAIARPGECWLTSEPTELRSAGAFVLTWHR